MRRLEDMGNAEVSDMMHHQMSVQSSPVGITHAASEPVVRAVHFTTSIPKSFQLVCRNLPGIKTEVFKIRYQGNSQVAYHLYQIPVVTYGV